MRLDMGTAWNGATAMIDANRDVLLVIAGVFFFLPTLALTLLVPGMQPPQNATEAQMEQFLATFWTDNGIWLLLYAVISYIGTLALLALLRDSSRPTVGEAIKAGAIAFLPYLGAQVLIGLVLVVVVGGLLGAIFASGVTALIVLGVTAALAVLAYVYTKTSLVAPVIAIERIFNPVKAIVRAWRLTSGNSVRLFLFYVLLFIAFIVIAIVLSMIIGLLTLALGEGHAAVIVSAIFNGLMGAVATVIFIAVIASVHRQFAGPSAEQVGTTFE